MEFLTVLLLLVGPEIVLSTSLYSAIVADHQNWCPHRYKYCVPKGVDHINVTTDCCGLCDCDLTECSKYGICCLNAYGSIEAARESIPHTLLVYNCMSIQLSLQKTCLFYFHFTNSFIIYIYIHHIVN